LSVCEDPAQQLQIARAYQRGASTAVSLASVARSGRIRVGYLSSDLRDHAVGHLLVGVLERHDRERFEIHAISLRTQEGNTPIDRRLRAGVSGYHDLGLSSDARAIERLRALDLDIAVDLNGYTAGGRPALLAARVAPVQVAYLGYAGSSGSPRTDYLIADAIVIPAAEERWYCEAVARLPHCYLPNDARREHPAVTDRARAALPSAAFVFCAFNQPYKISAQVFEVWMRLLAAVPGSVLWLKQMAPCPQRHLLQAAASHGIAAERLLFAPHATSMAEHLGRQALADLYLDTSPYTAHSSACDALWAGLPVLTCAGRTFASRVAASALHSVGLPELVTHDLLAYEQCALQLARDPARLAALRARLADERAHSTLFDTDRYTHYLECAFLQMWERNLAGLPPVGFEVQ
jgi:predicted O-linked N-acetylglucosamine transferase (SPINDLY family)